MQVDQGPTNIYGRHFTEEELGRDWSKRELARSVTIHVPDEGHVTYMPGDVVLPEHYRYMGEHCFRPEDPADEVRGDLSVFAADGAFEYDDLRVAQLHELCKQRGLEPRSNKRVDLIRILRQNDDTATDDS